ncbi:MAG: glycosyltransferase family 2 protein [Deltaproteobacteria bacterium]|nr:glycosyltransferase family 2 protein [Deltaproteobacteria bacterium]
METLSVTIITQAEEDNIRASLESVSFADEIIVVDSGSTDRTREICLEYTDKVHHRDWNGYASQKNAAGDMASGDWILNLDADERVTGELAAEIQQALASPGPGIAGYYLNYKVLFWGKWLSHGGFYPEKHLRLYRREQGSFPQRTVHEALEVRGRTAELKGHIEHYTYKGIEDFISRMQQYSTLSAREYARQGRSTGVVRMSARAIFTFIKMYILRRGFLDGYKGYVVAVLYSVYTFTKYAKLKELEDKTAP